jgi:RNA polymerase sporulation-specific sigma factor
MFTAMIQLALQNLVYFALHLENNGAFPKKLSKEEERECLEGIANGDLEARNKLIEHNLRLVAYIVKKHYFDSKEENDDLISIGTIGLINAAETFKMDKKINFSTYASKCIDNQIKVGGLLRHQIIRDGNAVNLQNRHPSSEGWRLDLFRNIQSFSRTTVKTQLCSCCTYPQTNSPHLV